ncbi:MAG: flagellar basal body rod protein FlgC [bacterium]
MSSGLFGSLQISATGLHGQRVKMDVVSQNLANAETTRTEDGTPYRRQRAVFQHLLETKMGRLNAMQNRAQGNGPRISLSQTHKGHLGSGQGLQAPETRFGVAPSVATAEDASEFRVVYDPGHPDADDEGYVLLPNVNVITEMVDMIRASRAYEANVSAMQAAKAMFKQALEL